MSKTLISNFRDFTYLHTWYSIVSPFLSPFCCRVIWNANCNRINSLSRWSCIGFDSKAKEVTSSFQISKISIVFPIDREIQSSKMSPGKVIVQPTADSTQYQNLSRCWNGFRPIQRNLISQWNRVRISSIISQKQIPFIRKLSVCKVKTKTFWRCSKAEKFPAYKMSAENDMPGYDLHLINKSQIKNFQESPVCIK